MQSSHAPAHSAAPTLTDPSIAGLAPVTRFAPSPTGHLHIGGARTALFCWAYAKVLSQPGKPAGRFLIRIEDTDQARSSDESARGILEDLEWLGISWDDGPTLRDKPASPRPVGPFFQAQRLKIYNAYLESLLRAGYAYAAFETAAELDVQRKEIAAKKQTYRYPRPADVKPGEFNQARWQRMQAGEPHVIRIVTPPVPLVVQDQVLGEVKFAVGEIDDFVLRKQDGFPTYHFAVVIDDELMGITHVMRAQEHLINTPRHIALQMVLERLANNEDGQSARTGQKFRTPVYAHLPLIFNIDGTKMSKRDKAKTARKALKEAIKKDPSLTIEAIATAAGVDAKLLADFEQAENDLLDIAHALAKHFRLTLPEIDVWDFRKSGYLPEAITNFLSLQGWSTGEKTADGKDLEKFDNAYLAKHFSLDRIGKTPAKFDRVKLLSFNGDMIAALSDEAFGTKLSQWAGEHEPKFAEALAKLDKSIMPLLIGMAKPRCKTLSDAVKIMSFAMVSDETMPIDDAAVAATFKDPAARNVVEQFTNWIASVPSIVSSDVDGWLKSYAEQHGVKLGAVAQPVRVALVGSTVSPQLGDVAAVLGKAGIAKRSQRVLVRAATLAGQ
jgi:glutamyl/glutaminyl-tRNA synthetase